MTAPLASQAGRPFAPRNRYGATEWAGAFGDLGTLIPFVAAYIGVVGLDPTGVLFAFGAAMVACGLWYRTPVPVQPMKAAGAIASVEAASIGAGTVHAAALVTGLFWLVLGRSGWMDRIARRVPRAAVAGLVLGLGLAFMLQGLGLMRSGWKEAALAGSVALVLLNVRVFPAMFALLAIGVGLGAWRQPELVQQLRSVAIGWQWPPFTLAGLQWQDWLLGTTLLALPQLPLTLGNAILAIREENDRRFPQRPMSAAEPALTTGAMNVFAGCVGGVPMCHGAGGMAAHVAFGARTGGAVVIMGALLLVLGLFFGSAVQLLFQLFAAPVLGVMLFLAGVQLARGAAWPAERDARWVLLAAAAVSLWNVAAGLLAGIALHWLLRRRAR
jgi:MFS superfamily sulfate permease-like transporter